MLKWLQLSHIYALIMTLAVTIPVIYSTLTLIIIIIIIIRMNVIATL